MSSVVVAVVDCVVGSVVGAVSVVVLVVTVSVGPVVAEFGTVAVGLAVDVRDDGFVVGVVGVLPVVALVAAGAVEPGTLAKPEVVEAPVSVFAVVGAGLVGDSTRGDGVEGRLWRPNRGEPGCGMCERPLIPPPIVPREACAIGV